MPRPALPPPLMAPHHVPLSPPWDARAWRLLPLDGGGLRWGWSWAPPSTPVESVECRAPVGAENFQLICNARDRGPRNANQALRVSPPTLSLPHKGGRGIRAGSREGLPTKRRRALVGARRCLAQDSRATHRVAPTGWGPAVSSKVCNRNIALTLLSVSAYNTQHPRDFQKMTR